MCRVGTRTRVPPTVQQRQPRTVVKHAEDLHRRAGAAASVASACTSKRSSASGGLGLATSRRSRGPARISAQQRSAMLHGANGPTRHKEAFSMHLQARQGPNAFALRLPGRPYWFWGRYMRDLAPYRVDSIQVISTLASSRSNSTSTTGAPDGFVSSGTGLSCLVLARPAYLAY